MIDIHSHILYGLDDGAREESVSLEMARAYQELGFTRVVGSSHIMPKSNYNTTAADIEARVKALNERLTSEGIGIELVVGAEYYLDREFPDVAESNWPLARINHSFYVLVEMPALFVPASLGSSFFNERVKNPELKKILPFLRLVLAHPERNEDVIARPEAMLKRLKEQGVYMQLNLGSLVGYYGKTVKKAAEQILKMRMADIVATDAHSPEQLRAIVPEGLARLQKLAGDKAAQILMEENPGKVLAGEPLEPFY